MVWLVLVKELGEQEWCLLLLCVVLMEVVLVEELSFQLFQFHSLSSVEAWCQWLVNRVFRGLDVGSH